MATSSTTPQKEVAATPKQLPSTSSSCLCSNVGPKPSADPGKGMEWTLAWTVRPIPISSTSEETSFEKIFLEKVKTVKPKQPTKRRKIDFGAVIITDEKYLEKISIKPNRTNTSKPNQHKAEIALQRDEEEDEDIKEEDVEEEERCMHEQLLEFWKLLSPPTKETELKQKWCAFAYHEGKKSMLFFGCIQIRFLLDDGLSPIISAQVLCNVKPCPGQPGVYKTISDSYISDTHQLPQDLSIVSAHDLLCPATMTSLKEGKWNCENFVVAKELFALSEAERLALHNEFVDNF